MKVLITGAAGFLGQECVKQFKQAGYKVYTTDVGGEVDIIGNLSDNAFAKTLPSVDVVVNCAAVQYVTKNIPFIKRKEFFVKNNVKSAENLNARYVHDDCHFVHVGTSMMYKQCRDDEYEVTSVMSGEGVYSQSKVDAQIFINKIPGSATIIPCIIGGEGREGLFRGFVNSIKKLGIVVFPGAGNHKINMVHVHDVASLILCVVAAKGSGFYNAAAPDAMSIRGWIAEIQSEIGVKKVHVFSIWLLPIMVLSWLTGYRVLAREQLMMLKREHVLSIKKSLEIGWTPKYTNAQIARDIARYISNNSSN